MSALPETSNAPGILGGDSSGTSLVDLLDRVVHRGAFVSGDVTICLAGIELVRLDLRLLLVGIAEATTTSSEGGAA
jgi:hypothetical protein